MMERTTIYWARWFCLPVVLFAVLFFVWLVCLHAGLNTFQLYGKAISGSIAAPLWVLATFLMAPDRKATTALISLLAGAVLSWFLLGQPYNLDYGGTTRLPTYITWASGSIAFAFVLIGYQTKMKTRHGG
jgi:hypothetical protein